MYRKNEQTMTLLFYVIGIAAACMGVYYIVCATRAIDDYDKWECVGAGILLAVIATLAFFESHIR
jgi:uncharacterized membrane protein HdeD (DUF308 family)